MIEALHNSIFYEKPEVVSSAPGKINLMGEHTQHSDGFIFSIAINRRVYVSVSSRSDDKFIVYLARENSLDIITKKSLSKIEKNEPITPVKAVLNSLLEFDIPGLNICLVNEIPPELGLSEISAVSIALYFAIRQLQNLEIENDRIFNLCEKLGRYFSLFYESKSDSIALTMARSDNGILVDCRNFKYEYAPISKNFKILIIDPRGGKVKRTIEDFLKRGKECKDALEVISTINPQIYSLRDLTVDELNRYSNFLDRTSMQRVRYIVSENERVLNFVIALRRRDISMLGKLLFDSHLSLRNDYEVSTSEIDSIIDISATINTVVGAKIFGISNGAFVLIPRNKAGEAIRIISEKFYETYGRKIKIYVTSPENGVEVKLVS